MESWKLRVCGDGGCGDERQEMQRSSYEEDRGAMDAASTSPEQKGAFWDPCGAP